MWMYMYISVLLLLSLSEVSAKATMKPEGCNNIDPCGVCEGDGSTCELVKKLYYKKDRRWGMLDTIETLPVGVTNVNITERIPTYNLMVLLNQAGKYIFRVPSWSKTVFAAGTRIRYLHEKEDYKDQLLIDGPTTEPLFVKYFYVYQRNTSVDVEYYKPVQHRTIPTIINSFTIAD